MNIKTHERDEVTQTLNMKPENTETVSGHSYPLLPVAVLQVVGGAIVPVEPDADEHGRQETIFSHDDKIGEEPAKSLDHTCRHRQSSVTN